MLRDEYSTAQRVRVAMVGSSLRLGGAEKQTVYMARALGEAGIDVRFFYLGPGDYYERVLRQTGLPVCQIHVPNRPFAILTRLVRALHRWQPHVVFASQFGDMIHGGIAGRLCRALTLGGVRSDGLRELGSRGWLSRCMFHLAHGFIANSHQAKRNLVSRGIKPYRLEILPNVIDLPDFDSRKSLPLESSLPSDRVIAAAVGSLRACKRFDRFIEALALARRREPALAGVIAGTDYGTKAALQEQAQSSGFTRDDLMFLGESDRVPALLARSALLVLTSDYEGFPNVILEAMAARLPVITTSAGDAGSIVQHGKTGYIVKGDDVEGLASFMARLARAAAIRKELGEAGRKRAEQEYNYAALSGRLIKVFQTFAARAGRASLRHQLTQPDTFLCAPCPA